MSFILDALKKSETERQRQNAPGFADVPDGADPPRAPRWLWALGALLAVNLVVLLSVMLRPELPGKSASPAPEQATANDKQVDREASFSDMVEEAKKKRPPQIADDAAAETTVDDRVAQASSAPVAISRPSIATSYSTFNELRANGTLVLPDLHLDIHVYSEKPAERFVFVNMSKYREQGRLAEGPLVREITPEGVILAHLGKEFLLPRE